ncbi:NAD(P)-dependent dehydrogenase, short-chain alcohol dehydrogenase family [Sinosporangium album]|uniref:NAD(P)-dependent dehydrogenase, short-chain alcohol dehydrogenase family n=1 Tax=Sinosporangium album TaxID=504805 RepID=A0A1G8GXK0_9ACTN|nr:SDR family oxidoreductase [Sinosporangium album]SDH98960.1 NAD(P)-dependent dehydrogenase, short-chain alcohol dehydrogenase family [Sinosporangium album]
MKPLDGKVALVTGGSKGIGAAIAVRLAHDGADVAFTYRSSPQQAAEVAARIEQEGGRATAIQADLAAPETVISVVQQVATEHGRIDILVNNAGVYSHGPIEDYTLSDYDETMAVNVRAAFLAVQQAVRHMPPGGRIITVGSNLADRVTAPGLTLYAMSKSALIGFTKGIARDLGPRGITATLLQPGSTNTDMNPADSVDAARQLSLNALGRFAEPAEIAATAAYLAGPDGAFATGTAVTVDGGVDA